MSSKKDRKKAKKQNDRICDEAWAAIDRGQFHRGRKLIQRAVDRAPANARYWFELGAITEIDGEPASAERSYRQALELSQDYVEPLRALGKLLARCGEWTEAVELQVRVVAQRPDSASDREALADLRRKAEPIGFDRRPVVEEDGPSKTQPPSVERTAAYDWDALRAALDRDGLCHLPGLLAPAECEALIELDRDDARFEHQRELGDRGTGVAVYRFFRRPLPGLVTSLRREVYWRARAIANAWCERFGEEPAYPDGHEQYLEQCRAAGQRRTTPLLFRYEPGASNDFHRDLAGAMFFPLQLAVTLGPGNAAAGDGGEFVLADEAPGRKPRRREVSAGVGDGVLFCARDRPVQVGGRPARQPVAHGVREITGRRRYVLGVPFHDYR